MRLAPMRCAERPELPKQAKVSPASSQQDAKTRRPDTRALKKAKDLANMLPESRAGCGVRGRTSQNLERHRLAQIKNQRPRPPHKRRRRDKTPHVVPNAFPLLTLSFPCSSMSETIRCMPLVAMAGFPGRRGRRSGTRGANTNQRRGRFEGPLCRCRARGRRCARICTDNGHPNVLMTRDAGFGPWIRVKKCDEDESPTRRLPPSPPPAP